MTAPAETTVAASAEVLASEYEELRRVALVGSAGRGSAGYTLFLRRGMAAWMAACRAAALSPRPSSVPRQDFHPVPPDLRVEVAQLLAAMALGRTEGGMTA